MRSLIPVFALTPVFLATVQPLAAHDFWIEPSTFTPGAGAVITVDLKVGEGFQGRSVPRRAGTIDRLFLFTEMQPAGQGLAGTFGLVPAGVARTDGRSTALIAYDGGGGVVELPPDRFERYLRSHGLEWVIEERKRRKEETLPVRERFHRHAKALLSGSNAGALAQKLAGQTLELVPEGDPTQTGDANFSSHVLWRGQKLAGCLIVARSKRDPGLPLFARSGSDGRFHFLLQSGVWMLQAVWMERSWFRRRGWESHWASLTFQKPGSP